MFSYFSDHEQKVLAVVIVVLLMGCAIPLVLGWITPSKQPYLPRFTAHKANKILDINTATQQELEKLPGIGINLSQRIIEYRNSKGRITSLEELRKIKGLTKKVFRQIYFRLSL